MSLKRSLVGIGFTGCTLLAAIHRPSNTWAQSAPPPGVNLPPNIPERIITPQPSPTPTPTPTLPAPTPPALETPAPTQPGETPPPSNVRFRVNKIEVLGNTVLQAEIAKLVTTYENRDLSFEDLIALRSEITRLYVENGYVTSGAFLPANQVLNSGIVRIQVVEGELERIEVNGLRRLQPGYVRSRIALETAPPLNRQRLERALQLLQLNPLFNRVNAELTAGSVPGRNVLRVTLEEASPLRLGFTIDNNQTPSVGEIQGGVFASHENLLGFGDRLSGDFSRTSGLSAYSIGYSLPVNPRDGTVSVRYSRNTSKIVEAPFDALGIRSNTNTLSFNFRQPLVRSPQTEFALGVGFDLRRSRTFLLDNIPFSFSEGPENGVSKISAIRFTQDWVQRGAQQVVAARSQFSFGIDAFDATVNDTGTDAKFFSWLGQVQWVRQISPRNLFLARFAAQLTPDSLLSLERFSFGGVDTVRGYRQNQVLTDNGVIGSLELRIPVTGNPNTLQLTPFFDFGTGWNNRIANPDPRWLAGIGIGLQSQIGQELFLRVDYGIPLIPVENGGNALQDSGVYFSIRYQPL